MGKILWKWLNAGFAVSVSAICVITMLLPISIDGWLAFYCALAAFMAAFYIAKNY